MQPMYLLWPAASQQPVDDGALRDLYPSADRGKPWLRVNVITSIDGAASIDGRSTALSGREDKRVFGLLRATCDALLVGAGTAKDEEYGPLDLGERRRALRRNLGIAEHPPLVLLSGRLSLDPQHPMFTAAPVHPIVVTTSRAPNDRFTRFGAVADVIVAGEDTVDLPAAIAQLRARGLLNILCEGGPAVLGALIAHDLVDEVCLTVAPLLVGGGPGRLSAGHHAAFPQSMRLRHVLVAGDVLLLRYTRDTAS